jgi:hypothetical protein
MVAYEETQFTTAKHRGIDLLSFVDAPNPMFHDRIFSRTTLQAYGDPIDKFETRLQLLYAFRDAIAGKPGVFPQLFSCSQLLFIVQVIKTCGTKVFYIATLASTISYSAMKVRNLATAVL